MMKFYECERHLPEGTLTKYCDALTKLNDINHEIIEEWRKGLLTFEEMSEMIACLRREEKKIIDCGASVFDVILRYDREGNNALHVWKTGRHMEDVDKMAPAATPEEWERPEAALDDICEQYGANRKRSSYEHIGFMYDGKYDTGYRLSVRV